MTRIFLLIAALLIIIPIGAMLFLKASPARLAAVLRVLAGTLLLAGGTYLSYEGAHKVWGKLTGHGHAADEAPAVVAHTEGRDLVLVQEPIGLLGLGLRADREDRRGHVFGDRDRETRHGRYVSAPRRFSTIPLPISSRAA